MEKNYQLKKKKDKKKITELFWLFILLNYPEHFDIVLSQRVTWQKKNVLQQGLSTKQPNQNIIKQLHCSRLFNEVFSVQFEH